MSTLVAQTISNGTVSTSSANVIQGSAKAWVNFNGTLVSPGSGRANYNVSSVTKAATGDYTINFTNTLPNANYSVLGTVRLQGISNTGACDPLSYATGNFRMRTINSAGTGFDSDIVNIAVFSN
jgi:hypothetical protein